MHVPIQSAGEVFLLSDNRKQNKSCDRKRITNSTEPVIEDMESIRLIKFRNVIPALSDDCALCYFVVKGAWWMLYCITQ